MRKEKCCIVISMCGMCEIKKYAKIYTKKSVLRAEKALHTRRVHSVKVSWVHDLQLVDV